jgi:hypothetical protein
MSAVWYVDSDKSQCVLYAVAPDCWPGGGWRPPTVPPPAYGMRNKGEILGCLVRPIPISYHYWFDRELTSSYTTF